MQIQNRKLGDIKPYEKNPRKNEEAVGAVAASIKEFGFKVPIVIDSAGVIVAGHTRYKAAKRLGLAEVPCIVADDLTPEQIKAFRLADNRTGEYAKWDDALLADIMTDLNASGYNLGLTGFTDDEIADILAYSDEEPHEDETAIWSNLIRSIAT